MRKSLLTVIVFWICAFVFSFFHPVAAQTPASARVARTHVIKKGETLYRLTQLYRVSAEAICQANPGLSADHFPIGRELHIPAASESTSASGASMFAISNRPTGVEGRKVKAAVVLPFGLDGHLPESARMLEFYQGVLIAVDTLKKQGYSVDLHVYDSGAEGSSIRHILEDPVLKTVDLIIGGCYWGHIKQLSDFSKEHRIRMILPFSSNDFFVSNNPELYMVNSPQPQLYPIVQDRFATYFPEAQVFFLDTNQDKEDKRAFIYGLKQFLAKQKISYETVSPSASAEDMARRLKKKKLNVMIPVSGSRAVLEEWMPKLVALQNDNGKRRISLFGYPEWQTYTGQYLNRFHALDTYIYTAFYTSNLFPSSQNFRAKFRRWFRREPSLGYPRYSMLGYDIALYFFMTAGQYGMEHFSSSLQKLEKTAPTLQHGFSFRRMNDQGGYINQKIYFINFSRTMEVIKTELQ